MNGAIPLLPQYAFMAWCSVKAQGQLWKEKRKKTEYGIGRGRETTQDKKKNTMII
jgi:hypothetical protein